MDELNGQPPGSGGPLDLDSLKALLGQIQGLVTQAETQVGGGASPSDSGPPGGAAGAPPPGPDEDDQGSAPGAEDDPDSIQADLKSVFQKDPTANMPIGKGGPSLLGGVLGGAKPPMGPPPGASPLDELAKPGFKGRRRA